MVTILPEDKRYGQIGQAFGQGFADASEQKIQGQMLGDAMSKIQSELNTAIDQGRDLDIADITGIYAKYVGGLRGGKELMNTVLPMALNKYRNDLDRRIRGGQETQQGQQTESMPSGEESQDGQQPFSRQTIEDRIENEAQIIARANQIPIEEGRLQARKKIAEQESIRQSLEEESNTFWKNSVKDTYGNDIDPKLLDYFKNKFNTLIQTKSLSKAWEEISPYLSSAQQEIQNVISAPGRVLWGDPANSIKEARRLMPTLIEAAPELAMNYARETFGLGPREAAEMVRPGSAKYEKFKTSTIPKLMQAQRSANLEQNQKKMNRSKELAEKTLTAYLKDHFDTKKDSLLAVKGLADELGIAPSKFSDIVNKIFPDKNKLSDYNRREVPKLDVVEWPSLAEIFRGSNIFEAYYMAIPKKLNQMQRRLRGIR